MKRVENVLRPAAESERELLRSRRKPSTPVNDAWRVLRMTDTQTGRLRHV